MNEKIPDCGEPEIYELLEECGAELVELDETEFDIKMQYPLLGMKYGETHCLLRKDAYEKLRKAKEFLPKGLKFRIWDAWRPFALQEELFYKYSKDIIQQHHLENASEDEKKRIIRKYVSEPKKNILVPPVHTTGGAVDLTLITEDGVELDMGTGFDAFGAETQTNYFERNPQNEVARKNRRILYHAMIRAGFTNLPSEWWHYDYGDRFWAYYNQKPAIFGGIFTREAYE